MQPVQRTRSQAVLGKGAERAGSLVGEHPTTATHLRLAQGQGIVDGQRFQDGGAPNLR